MAESKKSKKPSNPPSFWGAMAEVIQGLKKQPILLYGFGLAIIVFAAGALAIENLRVVAGTLLVLALLVMIVMVVLKALALSSTRPTNNPDTVRPTGNVGGNLTIGSKVIASDNEVTSGNVPSDEGTSGSNVGGNLTIGSGSQLKNNSFNVGNVTGKTNSELKNNTDRRDKKT